MTIAKTRSTILVPLVAGSLALAVGLAGCGGGSDDKGPAETSGAAVDKAAKDTGDAAKKGTQKTGEAIEKGGEKVQDAAK